MKRHMSSFLKIFRSSNESQTLSYFSLFRFASKWDLCLLTVAVMFTFFKALAIPAIIMSYSEFLTLLVERTTHSGTNAQVILLAHFGGGKILVNATKEDSLGEIFNDSIAYASVSVLTTLFQLVMGIISIDFINRSAIRQTTRIRKEFFQSMLRQEVGWYDVSSGQSNLATCITDDIEKIRDGIAEKVCHFLYLMCDFVICIIISFIYGWELTLIVFPYIPIIFVTTIIFGRLQASLTSKEQDAYSLAANVAEEVLSGIRTIFAFAGEKVEIQRYDRCLQSGKRVRRLNGLYSSIAESILRLTFIAAHALACWLGIQWILQDRDKMIKTYTSTDLLVITYSLVCGAENIIKAMPFMETFAAACGSAKNVFAIIDRKSQIDSLDERGIKLECNVEGNIEFRGISFSYPSRPEVQILTKFNLKVKTGQSVALVGNSGNGKSTCLQLLQRFYDPDDGEIFIDDNELRSINIRSLRSIMASVGQEPVLFSTTIGENIRYGNPKATDKDIVSAAHKSGAHDFIVKLPQGYNTLVGEKGSQLSGGQKQRIAIARALIQNPKFLLLDEATSALDYQSEKYVQEALDRASEGRTTIVVSHRLSAIRNADRILFIEKGRIIEDGTHQQLLTLKGKYYDMISHNQPEEKTESEEMLDQLSNETMEIQNNRRNSRFDNNTHHDYVYDSSCLDNLDEDVKDPSKRFSPWKTLKRIVILARPDWPILGIATMSSFVIGSWLPFYAIFYGEILGAVAISDPNRASQRAVFLCGSFVLLGVILAVCTVCQTFLFSKAGSSLTRRLRSMTFTAILSQECGWFDDKRHSVGVLSAHLSGDAANIQNAIGRPLSIILQTLSSFLIGTIIAFSISFKLSLICILVFPVTAISVLLEARHISKSEIEEKNAIGAGVKIATEAISNIRTVASLRQESSMIDRYLDEMLNVEEIVKKKLKWRALLISWCQAIPYIGYATAFYFGGQFVAAGDLHYKDFYKVCESVLYASLVTSRTLVLASSLTSALVGAHRIFKIIDRESQIESPNVANRSRKPDTGNDIEYKRIDFRYPTRPDIQILNDFSLTIGEGKTIALVGPSGCGKSTCIQLLQRLYDPEHGRIHIGLDEISSDISLGDLRSKLSIVSQEPVLFNRTIAENIAYGDNTRDVPMHEIIEAAKTANVHNFIVQLPQGYDTNLGSKGTQLSGGQKQRIAIARALVRNPKILLLDEATSALDLHGEQIVQQALDKARTGRTCLIIAHRLSTIQNADVICVVQNGKIVETGTHNELMNLDGVYTNLFNAQK